MDTSLEPIGFIGLGIMGRPMAGHLLKSGHPLFVFSRTRAKAEPLLAAGATWCDSPADVARHVELVCTNVSDTGDVREVVFGRGGIDSALKRGGVIVDFSTIDADATRTYAMVLADKGITLLDAPVTGGEIGALNATLTIMVGGDAAAFERVRPMLERVGKRIVHVGPSGSGQLLKACNQVLCAVNLIGVCEALEIARRAGLDPNLMVDTLQHGAGGSWALATLGAKINAGDLKPAFMIKLMQKDLCIAQATAQRLGLPMPGTALAQQLFTRVESTPGGPELGTQAMILAYASEHTGQSRSKSTNGG
jgi:3-hydroxyisobutyrate dehydrogenase